MDASTEIVHDHGREFRLEACAVEPHHAHAIGLLCAKILLEDANRLRRHDEKVAALLEPYDGRFVVDSHFSLEPLEERNAEIGKRDVLRKREETTHAA